MADARPLYQRTAERLAGIIERSEPGSALPSEPALARQLGVSRATLREAMRSFAERGLIIRRQGVGTFVSDPPPVIKTGLEDLVSIQRLASQIGLQIHTTDLRMRIRSATSEEMMLLELGPGNIVQEITRVVQADGRPVAYLVDVLPAETVTRNELRDGFSGSVLDLLLARGDPTLDFSRAEISAVAAPNHVARSLHIQRGDVLLYLEASLYARGGRVVDRSCSYFLPGTFRFHLTRRVEALPR